MANLAGAFCNYWTLDLISINEQTNANEFTQVALSISQADLLQ